MIDCLAQQAGNDEDEADTAIAAALPAGTGYTVSSISNSEDSTVNVTAELTTTYTDMATAKSNIDALLALESVDTVKTTITSGTITSGIQTLTTEIVQTITNGVTLKDMTIDVVNKVNLKDVMNNMLDIAGTDNNTESNINFKFAPTDSTKDNIEIIVNTVFDNYGNKTQTVNISKLNAADLDAIISSIAAGLETSIEALVNNATITIVMDDNVDNKDGVNKDIGGKSNNIKQIKLAKNFEGSYNSTTPVLATGTDEYTLSGKIITITSVYTDTAKTEGYLTISDGTNTYNYTQNGTTGSLKNDTTTPVNSDSDLLTKDALYLVDLELTPAFNIAEKLIVGIGSVYSAVYGNKVVSVNTADVLLAGVSSSFTINVKDGFVYNDLTVDVKNSANISENTTITINGNIVTVALDPLTQGTYSVDVSYDTTAITFNEGTVTFDAISTNTTVSVPNWIPSNNTVTINKDENNFNESTESDKTFLTVKFIDEDLKALGESLTPSISVSKFDGTVSTLLTSHPISLSSVNTDGISTGFVVYKLEIDSSMNTENTIYEVTFNVTDKAGTDFSFANELFLKVWEPNFTFDTTLVDNSINTLQYFDSTFKLGLSLDEFLPDNTKPNIASVIAEDNEHGINFTTSFYNTNSTAIVSLDLNNSTTLTKITLVPIKVTVTDTEGSSVDKTYNVYLVPKEIELLPMTEKQVGDRIIVSPSNLTAITVVHVTDTRINYLNDEITFANNLLTIDLSSSTITVEPHATDDDLSYTAFYINTSVTFSGKTLNSNLEIDIYNDQDLDGINDKMDVDNDGDGIHDSEDTWGRNDSTQPIEINTTSLKDINFTGVKFNGTIFGSTTFYNCNFKDSEFISCKFTDSNTFTACKMQNTKFINPLNSSGAKLTTLVNFNDTIKVSSNMFTLNFNQPTGIDEVDYIYTFNHNQSSVLTLFLDDQNKVINAQEVYSRIYFISQDYELITDTTNKLEDFFNTSNGSSNVNIMIYLHSNPWMLAYINSNNTYTVNINGVIYTGITVQKKSVLSQEDFKKWSGINAITNTNNNVVFHSTSTTSTITNDDFIYYISDMAQYIENLGTVTFESINGPKTVTFDTNNSYIIDDDQFTILVAPNGERLTVRGGSFIQVPNLKVISQTIEINTFKSTTLSLSTEDIKGYTNMADHLDIKSIELSLPNGNQIYSDSTHVNSVSITKLSNNYNISLLNSNTCQFNINIKITVNNMKLNTGNNILVDAYFEGTITISAELLKQTGLTLGDPHITTVEGICYELPYKVANYRLLQAKDLIVNVSTRRLTIEEGEAIKEYYRQVTKRSPPKSLITNGVVYDRVIIYYKSSVINFSFSKDTVQQIGNEIDLFNKHTLRIPDKKLGDIILKFKFLKNPQEKYGIELSCAKSDNITGLLIKEFIAKSMEVSNLLDKKPKTGIIGKNKVLSKITKFKKK